MTMRIDSTSTISPNDLTSITSASDLIRKIDSAFSEHATCAISASKEANESRKNARIASEIARLFSQHSDQPKNDTNNNFKLLDRVPIFTESTTNNEPSDKDDIEVPVRKKTLTPPPPPPSSIPNGETVPVFRTIFNSTTYDNKLITDRSIVARNVDSVEMRQNRKSTFSERLARAHSEDILSLTLELDKVKRALEAEQMAHVETKSALRKAKEKNEVVEAQIEKLLNDMETQRENDARKVDELEEELHRSQLRVKSAEEDAQIALDLAKQNSDDREQVEAWLQKSLQEIQILRVHIIKNETNGTSDKKSTNGSKARTDDTSALSLAVLPVFGTSPTRPVSSLFHPTRAMVSAGQYLAANALSDDSAIESAQSVDESIEAVTEVSRRLRNRLKSLGVVDDNTSTKVPYNIPNQTSTTSYRRLGSAVDALEVCRNTAEILKASGRKLNLAGRWWTGETDTQLDEIHLEMLARHYCTAVEIELDQKHREIEGLESLCSVWEKGDSDVSNARSPFP